MASVDLGLSDAELLFLVFQVNETPSQTFNTQVVVIVGILIVVNDFLEELGILLQVSQLSLSLFKTALLTVDALNEMFNCLLVLVCGRGELLQSFIFLLSFLLIPQDSLLVGCDIGEYLSLFFQKLLLLLVQLLGPGDDVFFLLSETLVDLSLLSFLLEESDGLEWALTLHHEGSDSSQIFIIDLGLRVLAHVLVDPVEELIDLALLVNVHRFCVPSFFLLYLIIDFKTI